MNKIGEIALKAAIPVLQLIFNAMTPYIRKEMEEGIKKLYSKALATPNPLDDFGVRILSQIVGINLDDVSPAVAGVSIESGQSPAVTMPDSPTLSLTAEESGA